MKPVLLAFCEECISVLGGECADEAEDEEWFSAANTRESGPAAQGTDRNSADVFRRLLLTREVTDTKLLASLLMLDPSIAMLLALVCLAPPDDNPDVMQLKENAHNHLDAASRANPRTALLSVPILALDPAFDLALVMADNVGVLSAVTAADESWPSKYLSRLSSLLLQLDFDGVFDRRGVEWMRRPTDAAITTTIKNMRASRQKYDVLYRLVIGGTAALFCLMLTERRKKDAKKWMQQTVPDVPGAFLPFVLPVLSRVVSRNANTVPVVLSVAVSGGCSNAIALCTVMAGHIRSDRRLESKGAMNDFITLLEEGDINTRAGEMGIVTLRCMLHDVESGLDISGYNCSALECIHMWNTFAEWSAKKVPPVAVIIPNSFDSEEAVDVAALRPSYLAYRGGSDGKKLIPLSDRDAKWVLGRGMQPDLIETIAQEWAAGDWTPAWIPPILNESHRAIIRRLVSLESLSRIFAAPCFFHEGDDDDAEEQDDEADGGEASESKEEKKKKQEPMHQRHDGALLEQTKFFLLVLEEEAERQDEDVSGLAQDVSPDPDKESSPPVLLDGTYLNDEVSLTERQHMILDCLLADRAILLLS